MGVAKDGVKVVAKDGVRVVAKDGGGVVVWLRANKPSFNASFTEALNNYCRRQLGHFHFLLLNSAANSRKFPCILWTDKKCNSNSD